ncbi:ANTAR domain-containing response regulator [Paracoccus thiocyanatus]|nr:ANTAR domain-containing protein [Paracoccus thiocyanatus]
MTQVRSNFRGLRACLLLPGDSNREVLERTLTRLGLEVTAMPPAEAGAGATRQGFDVVFVDADQDFERLPQDIPHVALIGIEAPSRLARVIRAHAAAVLPKPVRVAGVFSALFFAVNVHGIRQRDQQQRMALQRRADGRRVLIKAIIALMQSGAMTDDEAYGLLRKEAMRRRIPVETYAAELVAGESQTPPSPDEAGQCRGRG